MHESGWSQLSTDWRETLIWGFGGKWIHCKTAKRQNGKTLKCLSLPHPFSLITAYHFYRVIKYIPKLLRYQILPGGRGN